MEDNLRSNWEKILEYMHTNFAITDVSYRTFIQRLNVHTVEDNKLTVLIDDSKIGDSKDFIEKKYKTFLEVSIEEIIGIHYSISFINKTELQKIDHNNRKEQHSSNQRLYSSFNPDYTFETFIVGDNNSLAHAASVRVAEEPGEIYNPLYIYGGAGLGKTHLMHAIANYILDHDPTKRVIYVTSETFTNEIVEAVRGSKSSQQPLKDFRKKYRENVDVLLIDDIQFIIGKESTQQEFFFTFQDLTENKKQVIISSDKKPSMLTTLDDRLKSRFEMGITADIKPPTYETRMAILRSKINHENISVDDSILDYIADNIVSNIRELQGAINKVISYSKLCGEEVTMDLAKEALADKINPNVKHQITIDYILEMTAEHFHITTGDLISDKRPKHIAYARQICMYLCRELTQEPLAEIGDKIGGRDHSTVIHNIDRISTKINENDTDTIKHIDVLKKKIDPN